MSNKRVHHTEGHSAGSQKRETDSNLGGLSTNVSKETGRTEVDFSQHGKSSRSSSRDDPTIRTDKNGDCSKRSRKLGSVTSHACAGCRKSRVKCDGQTPCGRCKLKGTGCVYKTIISQSKAQLRQEICTLRERQKTLEHLITGTAQTGNFEQALAYIRSGKQVESGCPPSTYTAETLESSENSSAKRALNESEKCTRAKLESGAPLSADEYQPTRHAIGARAAHYASEPWLRLPGSNRFWDAHTDNAEGKSNDTLHVLPFDDLREISLSETWTCVTDNIELTHHLLALYFCWEYPNFAPVSKEHFLHDFHEKRHRYCSPLLVNAILALGSDLTDRPSVTFGDFGTYGDNFFEEARRLFLSTTDRHCITVIQALVIMSTRESRYSRLLKSRHYAELAMRLAIEMGLHVVPADACGNDLAVVAKTFWGAFTLNQASSFIHGTLPQCSNLLRLPPKPTIYTEVETSPWLPYVDGDAHLQPHLQSSNVRSVYQCFCELNEAVHQSLYLLYSPEKSPTAAEVLHHYRRYLDWYDKLPEIMRLGHNSTPAVLFVHLYYHFVVLLHFQPFLKLRLVGSQMVPQEICSQAADAIGSLVTSYAKLYTLRRTPAFVPYFTFASAAMRIALASKSGHIALHTIPTSNSSATPAMAFGEALEHDFAHLTEMAPHHSFAKQALHMLRDYVQKFSISVDANRKISPLGDLTKPHDNSLSCPALDIASKCVTCRSWMMGVTDAGGTGVPACSIEHTSPSLFQLHCRPVLLDEPGLAQLGFALL